TLLCSIRERNWHGAAPRHEQVITVSGWSIDWLVTGPLIFVARNRVVIQWSTLSIVVNSDVFDVPIHKADHRQRIVVTVKLARAMRQRPCRGWLHQHAAWLRIVPGIAHKGRLLGHQQ